MRSRVENGRGLDARAAREVNKRSALERGPFPKAGDDAPRCHLLFVFEGTLLGFYL